jgi:hypothetical protein
LVSLARAGQSSRFSYDANTNRLTSISVTDNSAVDLQTGGKPSSQETVQQTTTLQPSSNRMSGYAQTKTRNWTLGNGAMQSVSSSTSVGYAVDETGAITGDGLRNFTMDATGRLAAVQQGDSM